MKAIMLTTLITLVLNALGVQRPAAPPPPSQRPEAQHVVVDEHGASPEYIVFLKSLLYSDQPLEKVVENIRPDSPGADEEPWRSFVQALSHAKQGRAEEAKKDLRRVLSLPDPETRVLLSAWTALRTLGERPPPGEADRIQGVVCELHNEAGVGTLAAYADGRARWLGGKGKVTFWEAPGSDKEIDALIADLLKTVGPLLRRAPAAERRAPTQIALNHFRVSILTFGGVHVIDVYGPDIDGKAGFAAPALLASVKLLDGLSQRASQKDK